MPIANTKPVTKPQTPEEIIESVKPDTPAPQYTPNPIWG